MHTVHRSRHVVRHSPQHMVRYCAANQQAVGKIRPTDGRTTRFAQRNNDIRALAQNSVTRPSDDARSRLFLHRSLLAESDVERITPRSPAISHSARFPRSGINRERPPGGGDTRSAPHLRHRTKSTSASTRSGRESMVTSQRYIAATQTETRAAA